MDGITFDSRKEANRILIQEAAEPVAIEPEVELEPEPEPVKEVNITRIRGW